MNVADRSFRDIAATERLMREQAEAKIREYSHLLAEVAAYYAGEAMEEERRRDPNAPGSWQPGQWSAFFSGHVFLKKNDRWGRGEGPTRTDDLIKQLETEVASLRQEKAALQRQVDELKDGLAGTQADSKSLSTESGTGTGAANVPNVGSNGQPFDPQTKKVKPSSGSLPARIGNNGIVWMAQGRGVDSRPEDDLGRVQGSLRSEKEDEIQPDPIASLPVAPVFTPSADGVFAAGYEEVLAVLRAWSPPEKPARLRQLASIEEKRWRRQAMALFVLARYGICARIEIDALVGQATGAGKRTSSLREAIDQLHELRFLTREMLEIEGPLNSRLALMQLSEAGRELVQIFGWTAVESEWERAHRLGGGEERLRQEHLLALFSCLAQARGRGYTGLACPLITQPCQPDLYLEKGTERYYVFIAPDGKYRSTWRKAGRLPGIPAFFTLQRADRQQLVRLLQDEGQPASRLKSGVATDLESLIGVRNPGPDTPLWFETW